MATESKIAANRQNALLSSGPRTEAGKAASSPNALTFGLYTRADYVRPEERDIYREFCETLYTELNPEGLLEESFVAEITGATWRLRRCSAVEAELTRQGVYSEFSIDPMLDESTEKTRRSIERARAHTHSLLHRAVNQLRRLQTERACRLALNAVGDDGNLADYQHVVIAANNYERGKHLHAKTREIGGNAHLASICNGAAGENNLPAEPVASLPRNAPCPCHSGEKYKRCCGRNAPPVLGKAA
jgi:hypothetical protein